MRPVSSLRRFSASLRLLLVAMPWLSRNRLTLPLAWPPIWCQAVELQATVGRRQQHAGVMGQRPDPLELPGVLRRARHREQAVGRLLPGLIVESAPGAAQGQVVGDAGAAKDVAHGVGIDALYVVAAGEALAVGPHVEGREAVGLQSDLIVGRQFRLGGACSADEQGEQRPSSSGSGHGIGSLTLFLLLA